MAIKKYHCNICGVSHDVVWGDHKKEEKQVKVTCLILGCDGIVFDDNTSEDYINVNISAVDDINMDLYIIS